MRHKQMPIKASRHKSLTLIIGSQTSFSSQEGPQATIPATSTTYSSSTSSSNNTSNNNNNNTNNNTTINNIEHNYRHMSGVMRLAFLENNDISFDDCNNVDFNSLSTASILQRNIQQQLQRERDDQLQFTPQQQQSRYQQDYNSNRHQIKHEQLEYAQDDVDQYDEISDSHIFATADHSDIDHSYIQLPHSHQAMNLEIKETSGDGFYCDEPDCGKSFPSLRKLRHHKVVHSNDFPYICEFNGCSKKFKRKFGIDLHSTTHFDLDVDMYTKVPNNNSSAIYGKKMQYGMCKPCGQKFKTVHEYQYHMLKHGKEPFKCSVKGCGQTFSIWKSFQKHRASHYYKYYCKVDPGCEHHTTNLQLLKLHIYCCHFKRSLPENATLSSKDTGEAQDASMEDESGPDDSTALSIDDQSLGLESIEPEDPLELIETPPKRRLHNDSSIFATASPSNVTPRSIMNASTPRSQRHQQQMHLLEQQQQYLNKQQPHHNQQQQLQKQHQQQQQLSTPGSSNSSVVTRSKKRLIEFIQHNHQEPEEEEDDMTFDHDIGGEEDSELKEAIDYSFHCDEPDCNKSFPSLRKLRHHKVVHSDDFPYICEFNGCSKKFKRKFGIDLHSTTHFDLDVDMYTKVPNNNSLHYFGRRMQYSMCKPCGQKFKTVHDYQYHMLNHGKEPFKCPVKGCGQTFSIWKSFQKHRASHYYDYYCKVDHGCNHHTSNLQLLKLHIYCCHFKRRLPENATLTSRKEPVEVLPDELESIESL